MFQFQVLFEPVVLGLREELNAGPVVSTAENATDRHENDFTKVVLAFSLLTWIRECFYTLEQGHFISHAWNYIASRQPIFDVFLVKKRSCGCPGTLSTMETFQKIYRPEIYNANAFAGEVFKPSLQHEDFSLTQVEYDREERSRLAVEQGKWTEEHFIKPYGEILQQWSARYA